MKIRSRMMWLVVCSVLASAGCGGPRTRPDLEPVSGTVTFQGQPLKWGSILFEPLQEGLDAGGADIADGKFHMPKERGLAPGNYRVRIYGGMNPADDPMWAGPQVEESAPESNSRDRVPLRFNEKSTLTAEIRKGGTVLSFDLR